MKKIKQVLNKSEIQRLKDILNKEIIKQKNSKYYATLADFIDEPEKISFHELTEKLKPYFVKEHGKNVEIRPKVIVAVTYQEVQKSPNYNSGFALRFPRFTALRNDKPLSEITSLQEIEKDIEHQKKRNYMYG